MPENGVIQSISVCCAADAGQGSCTAALVVYNGSTGALICQSANFTMAAGTRTTSGWSFTTKNVTAPTFVASGTSLLIGFWRSNSGSTLFPVSNAGSYDGGTTTNTSSPPSSWGTQTANWGSTGTMGAFATYVKAQAHIWNGSTWVAGLVQVWNGSTWVTPTGILVWNGSSWVNAT